MPMGTKLGRVVTSHEGLPCITSRDFSSRGLTRSRDKLKTYIHYHNTYGHQT